MVSQLAGDERTLRRSAWLSTRNLPVPIWLHAPRHAERVAGAAVIAPPLGYEYTHSYRSLLHLADCLAGRGLLTVRFDYVGTGSAPGDAFAGDLVARWLGNIRDVAAFAATLAEVEACHVVGVQMGATLAATACSELAVQSLVLWAPVVRGRTFVRERRLLAATDASRRGPADDLDAGGFVLSAEAARHLGLLDMSGLDYRSVRSGILIVHREDVPPPPSFAAALSAQGVDVDVREPGGYVEMIAEPQYTAVPHRAVSEICAWVAARLPKERRPPAAGGSGSVGHPALGSRATVGRATEELVLLSGEAPLAGVLTVPTGAPRGDAPVVLLSNAGAVHQVGPNRTYVELTRALAEVGFPSLRLDLRNLGDSIAVATREENHPYPTTASADIDAALRWLRARGFERAVLGGLCSGAHTAFRACLELETPPCGLLLINPLTFNWSQGMTLDTPDSYQVSLDAGYYRSAVRDLAKWRRLLTGRSQARYIGRFIGRRARHVVRGYLNAVLRLMKLKSPSPLDGELRAIASRGTAIDLVFADSDPGLDILRTEGTPAFRALRRRRLLSITTIRGADHTFSKAHKRAEFIRRSAQVLAGRYGLAPPLPASGEGSFGQAPAVTG